MHSPFTIREELVALDTGLVDVGHSLMCDKADEAGGDIQKEMDGQVYTDCSIKHSKQIAQSNTANRFPLYRIFMQVLMLALRRSQLTW